MGGILGALAFKTVGYFTTVPIAIFLLLIASPPIIRDVFFIIKNQKQPRISLIQRLSPTAHREAETAKAHRG